MKAPQGMQHYPKKNCAKWLKATLTSIPVTFFSSERACFEFFTRIVLIPSFLADFTFSLRSSRKTVCKKS